MNWTLAWALAAGMLVLYVVTLNPWVSPGSLRDIARLSGLTWQAELTQPVFHFVAYPFHWLPPARVPIAANFFTALCAMGVLAQLARSVSLLPHDRTEDERVRNPDPPYLLNVPTAWFPPVLAVLACGLQLTFWENAVSATTEMFDLLLFAYLVRCVLEYRVTKQDSWLLRWAVVDGLAIANNWAMVALLPLFVAAWFWVLGISHCFSYRFVARVLKEKTRAFKMKLAAQTLGCWLTGFSAFFWLPLLAQFSTAIHPPFWTAVELQFFEYRFMLTTFPRQLVLMLGVTSVIPAIFMNIRWGPFFGGFHRWTRFMADTAFNGMHGFFLLACLWATLDSPFSPRHLQPVLPCLPLYYLGALCIGQSSGYFLLVFGRKPDKMRRRKRPLATFFRFSIHAVIFSLAIAAPAVLIYKNLPHILHQRDSALARCFDLMQKSLPPRGTVILSQDPLRLEYLESTLIRRGRLSDYLLIDTSVLPYDPAYAKFLDRTHPEFKLSQTTSNQFSDLTNSVMLVLWLKNLSATHDMYLMHPFTGLLMEAFNEQPHGLFYQLQPSPTNSSLAPSLSPAVIAENRMFWREAGSNEFPALLTRIEHSARPVSHTSAERIRNAFRLPIEPDYDALLAGQYYSLMLNGWGAELQRLGLLTEAGKSFETARQLNSFNEAAQLNFQCNRDLQAHKPLSIDPELSTEDRLGQHRNWDQSFRCDGPTDDPNTCTRVGTLFANARMYRQAARQFDRVATLVPDDTNAPLRLAELYLQLGEFTNSLAAAEHFLQLAPRQPRGLVLKGLSLVYLRKFYQAIPPLDDVLNFLPDDPDARIARALAYLNSNKLLAAREDYEHAVKVAPTAYPAYFGLAEISYRRKETAETIKNCELYLSNAPPAAPEIEQVKSWLEESKVKIPPPSALQ